MRKHLVVEAGASGLLDQVGRQRLQHLLELLEVLRRHPAGRRTTPALKTPRKRSMRTLKIHWKQS